MAEGRLFTRLPYSSRVSLRQRYPSVEPEITRVVSNSDERSRTGLRSKFISFAPMTNHDYSKASYLYCVLCHKHHEEEKSKEQWKQIWLTPVVQALDTSTPLHRSLIAEVRRSSIYHADIHSQCFQYILPKILKSHPECLPDLKQITGR
jgi:hypothetical protein